MDERGLLLVDFKTRKNQNNKRNESFRCRQCAQPCDGFGQRLFAAVLIPATIPLHSRVHGAASMAHQAHLLRAATITWPRSVLIHGAWRSKRRSGRKQCNQNQRRYLEKPFHRIESEPTWFANTGQYAKSQSCCYFAVSASTGTSI